MSLKALGRIIRLIFEDYTKESGEMNLNIEHFKKLIENSVNVQLSPQKTDLEILGE